MRKIPRCCVIGSFLLVFAVAEFAVADVTADLKQAERLYKRGQFSEAEQVYRGVLKTDSNDVETVYQAARALPCIYLAEDKLPQAQEAVDQLLTQCADHPRLPHAVHRIIEQNKDPNHILQTGQVYQGLLNVKPDHPQAVWLKMGIAIANVHLGNDEAVDATLQNIIAQHATDKRSVEAFGQTAWAYRKLGQYERARTVYQYVVDNWPKGDRAVFSQRGVVLCSMAIGDEDAAEAGLQKLFSDYADSPYMGEVLPGLAEHYRDTGDYEKARTLYQEVVTKFPDCSEAIRSLRYAIYCSLALGDSAGVDAGIKKLISDYATHKDCPKLTIYVARELLATDLSQASDLLQHVLDEYPDHDQSIFARVSMGHVKVYQGQDSQAETIYQQIMTDYANDPRLPEAVHVMAEGYYDEAERELAKSISEAGRAASSGPPELPQRVRQHFEGAIDKWALAINRWPEYSNVCASAHYFSAICYLRLDKPVEAIQCYDRLLSEWPNYERNCHALLRLAQIYKGLAANGIMTKSEAYPLVAATYQTFVDRYPEHPAATTARQQFRYYTGYREVRANED